METKIIKAYVSLKLAHADSLFAEAKEKMDRKSYIALVMKQQASIFPKSVLRNAEAQIVAKYKIPRHKPLFKEPTVEQKITDVLGTYGSADVLAFFKQETGLGIKRLAKAKIGGQVVTRPALIWWVERLEKATGKSLLMPDNDAPLAYLGDEITLGDIADYFGDQSPVIAEIRAAYHLA